MGLKEIMKKYLIIFLLLFTCRIYANEIKIHVDSYSLGEISDTVFDTETKVFKSIPPETNLIDLLPKGKNVIWLKCEFSLPENMQDQHLALFAGKIIMADEIYLNNCLLGKSGSMTPPIFNNWNHYRFYNIKSYVINLNKPNTMLMKIFGKGEINFNREIQIGEYDLIKSKHEKIVFYTERVNLYVAVLLLFFSIFPFIGYWKIRHNKRLLYLPLVLISYSIYSSNFFSSQLFDTTNPPIGNFLHQKIIFTAANFVLLYTVFLFSEQLKKFISNKTKKILYLITIIFSLIYFIIPEYTLFVKFKSFVFIIYILSISFGIAFTVKEVLNKNYRAKYILLSIIPVGILLFHDIIIHLNRILNGPVKPFITIDGDPIYLMAYGSSIFLFTSILIFTFLFINNTRKIEFLNENLEKKVEERTKELDDEKNKALEINQQLLQQLDLARNTQIQLMPHNDPEPHIASLYKPLKQVGGDLYDYIFFPDGRIGIFISDVSGIGVPAAFITLMIKTLLLQIKDTIDSPAVVLKYINNFLYTNIGGHYVTALYGIFNPNNNTFSYANAGHYPPIILKKDSVEYIKKTPTFPMAVMGTQRLAQNNKNYFNTEISLPGKSKLLLFTDGLLNVKSGEDKNSMFQYEEMENILKLNFNEKPKHFVKNIYSALTLYHGNEDFGDDVCLVCVDIN